MVLEKFHRGCIFAIQLLFPLGKGRALHLDKLEFSSPKNVLCQVWLKLAQLFWRKKFFCILLMYFHHFVLISPWKRARPFHLYKLESSLPKNILCQDWLKLALWFCRIFFNFVNIFSLFRYYLHLEKGVVLHLTTVNSIYPMMLCAKFG